MWRGRTEELADVNAPIVRPAPEAVNSLYDRKLLGWQRLTPVYADPHNATTPSPTDLMPDDDELRRAFDTLSDHLRDTLARELDAIAARIAETTAAERDRAVAAAHSERDRAIASARADHERALAAASEERERAIAAAAAEAAEDARQQARAEAEHDATVRIADAVAAAETRAREAAATDAGRRTAELQAQLEDAERRARQAQEDSRAALARAADAARASARPADAAPLDRLVASMQAMDEARSLTGILEALVEGAAREAGRAGVLLVRGGTLRTWRFAGFTDRFDQSQPFDVQFADAGLLADAARTKRTVAGGPAPSFAALAPGRSAVAVPLLLAGDIVAVLYADQGDGAASDFASPVELLARHAASALEAVTAFKTARALVENPPEPPAAPADDPDGAARRYARLLVSEIKLYHEDAVLAGRRERDIAARLAAQIERARALYEERVPPAVRAGHDYFHSELVRTLASGDPSLLGEVKA